MSKRTTMQALSSALRFAASRSAISSAEELAIMEAWNNTRTPAPASADAMEVWIAAARSYKDTRFDEHSPKEADQAAARIIQQYGDQREAAGFRRGVEAAAKVAENRAILARELEGDGPQSNTAAQINYRILALLETQEAG